MKTPEQRGPVGAWAYDARIDAELSPELVSERLAIAGVEVTPATIRGIESGNKKPSRQLLKALSALYGSHPPVRDAGEPHDLVAAISVQAAALQALADELRAWRTEDRAELRRLGLIVEQLARRSLEIEAKPTSPAPRAPAE